MRISDWSSDVCSSDLSSYYALRCEYLTNPMGIDEASPRLTWKLNDKRDGALQTAYRIVVGTDSVAVANGKGNQCDSDESQSGAHLVRYGGLSLKPFTRYFWTVERPEERRLGKELFRT